MKLYEIARELEKVEKMLEETGGELTDDVQKFINTIEMNESDKLENIGLLVHEKMSDIVKVDYEIERLNKIKKQAKNTVESLKKYTSWYLTQSGFDKYETSSVKYSFRNSKKVEITDIDSLDSKYIVLKTDKQADKKQIKKDISEGKVVTGAELVENKSLQIK